MLKKLIPITILILLAIFVLPSCKEKHVHDYVEMVYPSNCSENGYTQRLCINCGDELLYDFTPRGKHTGDVWVTVTEPSCKSAGSEERICTTCNKIVDSRPIEKLGHVSGKWTVTKNPTCKETGVEKLFCSGCGIDLETRVLAVTENHDFKTQVTAPTTENEGYTTYTCKVCDFSKKDDYVSKIEAPSSDETTLSNGEIYEMIKDSMVRIDAYDKTGHKFSLGSGFFISSDGKIATNYHVLECAYSLKVTLYSDESTYTVTKVLGYNKAEDVAVIQIEKQNIPYLEISTEPVKTGDTVYTIGCPRGVMDIFTAGIVSNPSVEVGGIDCIAITAPISPGNSGGPLLDAEGKVIGINSMTIPDSQNLNFAIKSNQITALNTNTQITVDNLYNSTLSDNAFEILTINMMINAQAVDGDEYIIYIDKSSSETQLGYEIYYILNVETSEITVRLYIVQNSKRLYMVELYLDGIYDDYTYSLYDLSLNQTTIHGLVKVNKPAQNFGTDYNNLFDIVTFRYNESDDSNADYMKQIYFASYQTIMQNLKVYISNSGTGLTMSHFGFNF